MATSPPHEASASVSFLQQEALEKKRRKKDPYAFMSEYDREQMQLIRDLRRGKRSLTSNEVSLPSGKKKKTCNVKNPWDLLSCRNPETVDELGKTEKQTSVNGACDTKDRARAVQCIARFLCTNGIPFNVARSESFKLMIEALGNYGPHLEVPRCREFSGPLLEKELEYTKGFLKNHEEERVKYGCSVMADVLMNRSRTLMNFLVNCPMGSMFVRSVDASRCMKTEVKIFELLDSFVEEIGEKNVVQVIIDCGSNNYVLAGKFLETKREHLFWTPCVSHCIDLMLEDIGKMARVKKAIHRGINLVSFIYDHTLTLNMMRKFTNKMELVRHGVTRFVTSFLTLQRLHSQKNNLRRMFSSDVWMKTNVAKDCKAKRAAATVLMPSFWKDVVYILKAMRPIVHVLRLVNNEKKPAMGYIYKAMDRAKVEIQNSFKGNEEKYKEIFAIIDRRWKCQLHHPLHAAGHFLNPEYFYQNPRLDLDPKVMEGPYKCIERLSENKETVDKISSELSIYKRAEGLFRFKAAVRLRTKMAPADWWRSFGPHTPNLQMLAIKVLSLTCSSWGCERNWSTFEHIHSKKRSRVEDHKIQDLVYIKYNQALKQCFDTHDVIDPILLDDIDGSNEWFVGEMGRDGADTDDDLVFDYVNFLAGGDVANSAGVGENSYTRQQTRLRSAAPSAEELETDEVQEEEIYSCSSSENDDDVDLDFEDDD